MKIAIVSTLRAACAALFYWCKTFGKARPRLTQARLHELLEYDPDTGEFRWLQRPNRRIKKGALAGSIVKRSGYKRIAIDHRTYMAHQLAWFYMTGEWCRPMIDHRDGNRANNCWSNLRSATRSENNANSVPSGNISGFKGVSSIGGRWHARISKNGRRHALGTYATPQEAHAAYVAAARELFGEFARTE